MKYLHLLIAICLSLGFQAQDGLKVGIHHKENIQRVALSPAFSSYTIDADGQLKKTISEGEIIYLQYANGLVEVRSSGGRICTGKRIAIYSEDFDARFKLQPIVPRKAEQIYPDVLLVYAQRGRLKMVNEVEFIDYVAGSVEAEAGKGRDIEFYKAQAILCRTYAISNNHKHVAEGFHVCDKVHCQVYHGVSRHDTIIPMAVEATEKLIAVDHEINPISTLFHSNCGGHTVSAGDVWLKPLPYCKAIRDTFCLSMPHSNWERLIPKIQWITYLENYHNLSRDSLAQQDVMMAFQGDKKTHFVDGDLRIPLVQLRKDWNLRSTYFAVTEEKDSILISGQGFGHGVGLCQEGAIRMAELGYSYDAILNFYFFDIHIINKEQLSFYRD